MEKVIQKRDEGRFLAYVATLYKVDGSWCSHAYKEYKPRFFKTEAGARRSTEKFIMLNGELLNLFLQERREIEGEKCKN